MKVQLQNIGLINSTQRRKVEKEVPKTKNTTSLPSFADAKNLVNVNFKAWNLTPNMSVLEREQFFKRINTVNFFNERGDGIKIALELKDQFVNRFNCNASGFVRHLQSIGRTLIEVNSDNWMVLLNNDELLPDMKINGMNYYLGFPSLILSADSRFCPTYPFFNEDDYYASPDANPVIAEHPKYLRIWGEGYVDYSAPDDLRLCKKLRDESSTCYLADMDYYFRTVSEYRQRGQKLIHDINGIYYKELSKYDLPSDLRKFPIYMNLKDGSLHAGDSEAFQITPRLPLDYNQNTPVAEIPVPRENHNRQDIQTHEVTSADDSTRFEPPKKNTPKIVQEADNFVKLSDVPLLVTIKDIKNCLKLNADKIQGGKIFNMPITKDGDSLLMAFLHIKPIREEYEEYKELLKQMAEMSGINYDQKDSMDMTALEWVITTENSEVLSLMKGQKLTQDPMLYNAYKNIKNPEFKKALLESGLYTLPSYKTPEEQEITISSIINKKYPWLTKHGFNGKLLSDVVDSFLNVLRNAEGTISGETVNIFKRIIELSEYKHLEFISKGMPLLKNEEGNIDIEKGAGFLAQYEKMNFGMHSNEKTLIYDALISVMDYNLAGTKGIFDILGIPCEIKDNGIILTGNYISVPAYQGRDDIDMDLYIRHYGIDENKLLKHITKVYGRLDLTKNERVTSLPNLKYASTIYLDNSQVTDLPKLEKAFTLSLRDSLISNLPELREVTELWIKNQQIINLPEIHQVNNSYNVNTKFINLPKIQTISYLKT